MQRSFTPVSRFLVVLALCPCLAAMVGCDTGGLSGPTGAVSGKVTYNGDPVPAGSMVNFVHDETSMAATGATGADGSYTLQMQGEGEVLAGAYQISVSPPAQAEEDPEAYAAMMTGGDAAAEQPAGPFPQKYQAAASSGETFTVKEGPNTYNLDMNDDA